MAHVFISYSHTDHVYARMLADHLLANGFDVWIDDRIDFGSNWIRAIFGAIDTCAAFILIMSPEADESDWVQKEYLHADARRKQPFPLLLSGEVLPYFRGVQYYDVRDSRLPEDDFLKRLTKFAPQRTQAGQDVASLPQQETIREIKHSPQPDVTGAYLTAAPAAFRPANFPYGQTSGSNVVAPPATSRARQRRSVPLMATAAIIVVLAAIIVLMANAQNHESTATTPTPDTASTQVAALRETAAAQNSVSSPTAVQPTLPQSTSHNGEIAFVSIQDIYLMDSDGSNVQRLTNQNPDGFSPAWSPDGQQIAFESLQYGNSEIYVMNADGSNVHRLTNNPANDSHPSWSPNGQQIAFASDRDGNYELYMMDADGSNVLRLTNNTSKDLDPVWAPDGGEIAFISSEGGDFKIHVLNLNGSILRSLGGAADELTPAWSPDSQQIAFGSNRDGNFEIYVMNADGSNVRRLTNNSDQDLYPSWSPDGTQIVFNSDRDGNSEIYVMNADGSNVRRLTNNPDQDWQAVWRPGSGATACGGVEVGGYCWYFGADSASCDAVCSSHGGYDSATMSYAGSGGSANNCQRVLAALSLPVSNFYETTQGGLGCFTLQNTSGSYYGYWDQQPTTSSGTYVLGGRRRVCACQH